MDNSTNISVPSALPNETHMPWVEDSETKTLYILMYVFAGIIVLPGIFGNGIIIAAVMKLHSLRTHTNKLIASLAVADLLVVFSMVTFVLMDKYPIKSIPIEVHMFLFPSIDMALGCACIWNLAAVSIDRGLAVMRPLQYKAMLSPKILRIIIGIIWLYSAIIFMFAMLRIKIQSEQFNNVLVFGAMIANFALPCFIIVATYIGIFTAAIKNIRVTKALEKALHIANGQSVELGASSCRRNTLLLSREMRVAFNVLIILIPFVVGWGFYFGTHWYEMITQNYERSNIYEFSLLVIPWINSSLNPVIYILATPSLRKGCRQIICGRRSFSKEGRFSTVILSSFTSRRPSWLERGMSVSSNGGKTPKRKTSTDSRGESIGNWKKTATTFLPMGMHAEEDGAVAAEV